jgi:1-aminocyclopropane-1-carboxylate deaminase/D-cysteine desulfhydrase-like pyridoxal-dependent ACC family enzyme
LDLTYTGKAFAGLQKLVEERVIAPESGVLFVHTGGTAELFTRSAALAVRA